VYFKIHIGPIHTHYVFRVFIKLYIYIPYILYVYVKQLGTLPLAQEGTTKDLKRASKLQFSPRPH